ncbi:aromatic ring-hydroxylating oxygenase subunit alpha [Iningainema tapete]|uniref:Aromatic ring-hydroxylating dioxygenase subunit alpha n=1 Tax=Iningainema tapete BLCC-T55 TaxID=2748662 RepID=A0A8J6XJZ8_9CYAN|nr:aromatic ring-hydroxylating dioxygenase subunit alpha [Iningainema tapete]MBD2773966.1 aromatic ring-hydroxylating dioxygenase subunit alpha [Iningainema tapete BLCC-T55]
MLVTKQPVFKRFWYPVIPISQLSDSSPTAFTLLGQKIVLWLDDSKPVAAQDRCCHRSAQLSKGKVVNGEIQCPYHGWKFNAAGACVDVPQQKTGIISSNYKICTYACKERYGYAWVCLGEPLCDIPNIAEASDPQYRLIHEFYEPWKCAGLRVMENEFDTAHPTFVHTTTFGSEENPIPDRMELEEREWGIEFWTTLGVANPELQQQNLKLELSKIVRTMHMTWYMPFTAQIRIAYPNGLVHAIVNTAVPIDDSTSQIVQFCLRNDTEAETKAENARAFDRAVTLEDKAILETTDYDVPLDLTKEQHMMTDKPGIMMRRKILALLKAHGEVEQTSS